MFLGVELDERANREARPDVDVALPGTRVCVWVVHAREDAIAARGARSLL